MQVRKLGAPVAGPGAPSGAAATSAGALLDAPEEGGSERVYEKLRNRSAKGGHEAGVVRFYLMGLPGQYRSAQASAEFQREVCIHNRGDLSSDRIHRDGVTQFSRNRGCLPDVSVFIEI